MANIPHYLRTYKIRRSRSQRPSGEVDLAVLARDIDRGYRHFCEARGIDPKGYNSQLVGAPKGPRSGNNSAHAVALHYLALDNPPVGTLRRMAEGAGLEYGGVWYALVQIRRARRAAA
jgi:hypothetical protein